MMFLPPCTDDNPSQPPTPLRCTVTETMLLLCTGQGLLFGSIFRVQTSGAMQSEHELKALGPELYRFTWGPKSARVSVCTPVVSAACRSGETDTCHI